MSPSIEWVGEKIGPDSKNEKMFSEKEKIEVFLPRLLLSYRTLPHTGRLESSSVSMGRQIRVPLTIFYSTN